VGTRARRPTPNQDKGHLSPISNSASNILFSFCFLSVIYPLCVFRLQTVSAESLCLDVGIQAQEAQSFVWGFMCFRGEWVNFLSFLRWLWLCIHNSSFLCTSKSHVVPRSCFFTIVTFIDHTLPHLVFEQSCLWSDKLQPH